MDDDFRPSSTLPHSHIHPHHPSHAHPPPAGGLNNSGPVGNSGGFIRLGGGGLPPLPPGIVSGGSSSVDDLGMGNNTNNGNAMSSSGGGGPFPPGIYRELNLILKELRVITDKIRDDEVRISKKNFLCQWLHKARQFHNDTFVKKHSSFYELLP